MYNLDLSKPEAARAFLLTLRALNAPTDRRPCSSVEAASAALAEAVASHNEWAGDFSLGELFTLADKLINVRDEQARSAPALYPINEIANVCGSRTMALTAAKLCGAFLHDGSWIDEGTSHPVLLNLKHWNPNG